MARLIDADALKNALMEPFNWNNSPEEIQEQADFNYFEAMIDAAPTIDAVPVVHARWKRKNELEEVMFDIHWMCSKCGQEIVTNGIYTPMNSGWHYCPNCGAKMDAKEGKP